MCDVCKSTGLDSGFMNGPNHQQTDAKLFKVFANKVSKIKICRVHDIELFTKGEKRFLKANIEFARNMASGKEL